MDKRETCTRFMEIIDEWGEEHGFEITNVWQLVLAHQLWGSIEAEVEKLNEALSQTDHYLIFSEKGWSLEHLVDCRPNMAECEVHKRAQKQYSHGEKWRDIPHGRYRVRKIGGLLDLLKVD